jgi:hypothetical protein
LLSERVLGCFECASELMSAVLQKVGNKIRGTKRCAEMSGGGRQAIAREKIVEGEREEENVGLKDGEVGDAAFEFSGADPWIYEVTLRSQPEYGARIAEKLRTGLKKIACATAGIFVDAEKAKFPEETKLPQRLSVDGSEVIKMRGETFPQ